MDTIFNLEEVRLAGEVQDFSLAEPVTIQFDSLGGASAEFSCGAQFYVVTYGAMNETYRVIPTMALAIGCPEDVSAHNLIVKNAFRATSRFSLDGDRLTLLGDDVTMQLVAQEE